MSSLSRDKLNELETEKQNLVSDSGDKTLISGLISQDLQITKINHKEENKRAKKEINGYEVPDGGWGWLVAIGGFVITMLLSSLGPCFGILFSRYLLELKTSSVVTAWIFNIQLFIWHLMGPFVRPLSIEFGWRLVGFSGVLLCSMSIILSAFSISANFLFFSFSLLSGVGGGLVVSMCYIIVPQYFNRRRGLANAIMMVGLCMGQILMPSFVRYLQDEQGFLGSTFIFGAIILNGCVGVAFFHPVEWHLQRKIVAQCSSLPNDGANVPILRENIETEPGCDVSKMNLENGCSGRHNKDSSDDGGLLKNEDTLTDSPVNSHTSPQVTDCNLRERPSSTNLIKGTQIKKITRQRNSLNSKSTLAILKRVVLSTVQDLGILRQRRALIIAFGNMMCMNAYFNFVMMVPFAMQAVNLTLQDAAWCITVMGIFNLISRIIISIMSDWSKFNMRLCCMTGLAVLAVVMFAFPLLTQMKWLVVLMGVFGCGLAATISLLHLVMIQYMGVEHLASVFGSTCLLIGIGFPTFGPLIGLIRDLSGSYTLSMWILSGMTSIAFLLWLFMPTAVAYDDAQRLKEEEEEIKETTKDVGMPREV